VLLIASVERSHLVTEMPWSATFTFNDPISYQSAFRAAEVEVFVTEEGSFHAQLTQIDLERVWIEHGRENLPRVSYITTSPSRAPILFLADANQPAVQFSGVELSSNAIIVSGAGSTYHLRTLGPCRWATMSLAPNDLAAASHALVGCELSAGSDSRLVHPDPAHMARLLRLHRAVRTLADAAPDILAHAAVTRSLEHELVHAMLTCLVDDKGTEIGSRWRHHSAIIIRFEELLSANCDRPMYLGEICAAIGVSERTLRVCCEEHLGMGPIRYLWLRRIHLARRALMLADPATTTVTEIATDHGFWELGRFAVAYRKLFGESPSASLRRRSGNRRRFENRPPASAACAFAY
jgi:AraC-like DNA-binding protein